MNLSVAQEERQKDFVIIGGAVRYNIVSTSYDGQIQKNTNTYATFDTWRLNVESTYSGIDLSFEYRWYPTYSTNFIHHGYIGYEFNENLYMKLGISQVPFGITKYASHSWWLQGPYYIGLEDDYDMGIKFDYDINNKLEFNLAYFRQAEPEGPTYGGVTTFGNSGPGRYSYDVIPGKGKIYDKEADTMAVYDADIRELDQLNIRFAYDLKENIEIGFSGQLGGIYNQARNAHELATAYAGHVVVDFGRFNFKGEYIYHHYLAKSNDGSVLETIQMGAYGSAYDVAVEGHSYVAGLAYTIDVDWGPFSTLQPYVDYTLIDKSIDHFYDTQQLVPGMLVVSGNIYTYIDYAMGVNHPWLTSNFGEGLGRGQKNAPWNKRFNINIGYYF